MLYTIPRHYQIIADEFKPLIRSIQTAFVHRPVPSGEAYADIGDLMDSIGSRASETLATLPSVVESLSKILSLPEEEVGIKQIKDSMGQVAAVVEQLIGMFHKLWKRPFPSQFANGQSLASAMLERPLRDLLGLFEAVVEAAEDPDAAVVKYGNKRIEFNLTLSIDEEAAAFIEWKQDVEMRARSMHQYQLRKEKDGSFAELLLAFLLGVWIGHDR